MRYLCNRGTDLDDLVGVEMEAAGTAGFRYGPLPLAMRADEELVLENSRSLQGLVGAKLALLARDLFIAETEEHIRPGEHFKLVFE